MSRKISHIFRVGRKILTKNPNRDDDEGESDMLEITHEYKTVDSSSPERLAVIASCRGYQRLQQYYEYPDRNYEDVFFDLMDIDLVPYGQPFDCTMNIQVLIFYQCTSKLIESSSYFHDNMFVFIVNRTNHTKIVPSGVF